MKKLQKISSIILISLFFSFLLVSKVHAEPTFYYFIDNSGVEQDYQILSACNSDISISDTIYKTCSQNSNPGQIYYFADKSFKIHSFATLDECKSVINTTNTLYKTCSTNIVTNISSQQNTTTSNGVYKLLAPIGTFAQAPDNIGDYFNTIFKIAIALCGVLAVVMIVIGGVQYMGDESIFGKTEAKSRITSAILGLLIALGSWAILNTINPDLLGGGGVHIDQVSADISSDSPQAKPTSGQPYSGTTFKYGDAWPSDQSTRTELQNLGTTVSQANCAKVGDTGCSSVYNLNTSFVKKLKTKCPNCELIITEGTAFWQHGLNTKNVHYPGGFTVDLRNTGVPNLRAELNTWTKVYKSNWYNGSGAYCYSSNGMGIVEESSHFHVYSLTGNCTTQAV
jgi:hypothetical protein